MCVIYINILNEIFTRKLILKILNDCICLEFSDNTYDYLWFLDFFKDKFANLTTDEKIKGLKSFELLFLRLHIATLALFHNFGRVNEWQVLLDKINSRIRPMNDLMHLVPVEEQVIIKKHIMEKKVDLINDAFIDLDKFLYELKGR